MGRVSRWFRSIFGGKEKSSPAPADEKSKWGFSKSFREKGGRQQQQRRKEAAPPSARAAEQRRGSYRGPSDSREWAMDGEDQTKRAIAVAAATAAVAEAAVVAAQAAAAVVRLTSSGRCITRFGGVKREEWAAVRIQAAFRGYLARRALRALKGLVKLQALVRGNIVRKQAAETLRCMQALVRVQSRARACRALPSQNSKPIKNNRPRSGSQRTESFEAQHSSNSDKAYNLKRNSSKSSGSRDGIDPNRAQSSSWQWLDSWIEERYRESPPNDDEKDAKILQIDAGKPQLNSRRRSNHHNDTCSSRSVQSPSLSSVEIQRCLGSLMLPVATDVSESPQFYSATSKQGNSSRGVGPNFSPARSDNSAVSMYSGFPNYMANTESSRAKYRSQSAPKQRPEFEKLGSVKSVAGNEYGHGRLAARAEVARRSSSLRLKFSGRGHPGSGRFDRLGIPEGF